jgi:hypothetical protein
MNDDESCPEAKHPPDSAVADWRVFVDRRWDLSNEAVCLQNESNHAYGVVCYGYSDETLDDGLRYLCSGLFGLLAVS